MKKIKMLIYGDPGVGKSVFASKAPKPFFITTDGNYEWLEDFGAKPEDHIQVNSWAEAKEAFKLPLDKYDTIVIDLLEDLFKWDEQEFCVKNKIEHIADLGYGKGYDITRTEFFIEIAKLLAREKHIILICHGVTFIVKDRRGVEKTHYGPSSRIPDKVIDQIEGRVRYCLRCYTKAEEQSDGTLVKKRFLSLVPKENEFGIARGIDESKVPHDIPLDFDEFLKWIGIEKKQIEVEKHEELAQHTKHAEVIANKVDELQATSAIESTKEESDDAETVEVDEEVILQQEQMAEENRADNAEVIQAPTVDETPKTEQVTTTVGEPDPAEPVKDENYKQPIDNNERLAAIRAKIAAAKAKNQNN